MWTLGTDSFYALSAKFRGLHVIWWRGGRRSDIRGGGYESTRGGSQIWDGEQRSPWIPPI